MMSNDTTFLVIDDQAIIRSAVKSQLREIGFSGKIFTADDGQKGFEELQKLTDTDDNIEFIICDIVMPNMNGLEFLKLIRSEEKYKNVPVLMLTAESEIKIVMDAILAGASNYLVKPWSNEDLSEKIGLCWKKHNPKGK